MRPRSLFVPAVLTVMALAVLIGLGTWQLERLHWKEALMARVAERVATAPVPLPPPSEWPLDLAVWEYRPVEVRGRFRPDLQARVYGLLTEPKGPLSGAGYWILTPLELEGGGGYVVVNRGFVPLDRAGEAAPPPGEVIAVRGLLRGPEERNTFTPDDRPDERLFFARDPASIGAAFKLAGVAPFTIDATETPAGGLPQAGETRLVFSNRHLEYALTWYGLAAALIGVFVMFALSRRRRLASPHVGA